MGSALHLPRTRIVRVAAPVEVQALHSLHAYDYEPLAVGGIPRGERQSLILGLLGDGEEWIEICTR